MTSTVVALTVVLYLVPIVALLLARSRRDRPLWAVALDIPMAVAADIVGVLVLSRLCRLEVAAFVARGLAVLLSAAVCGWRWRRGDRPAWPRALGARALGAMAGSAALGAVLSLQFSRAYHIWDRFWHIPLVPAIRAQQLPFVNVLEPGRSLSYHFSGDALAAMLQSFSLNSLHASHALSLAHDLVFALTGGTLGLLLVSWGLRGISLAMAGTGAWLLSGPPALLRTDGRQWAGYNFVNYLTLSFRPHVSLAGLLLLGFVGALLVRVQYGATAMGGRLRASEPAVRPALATSATAVVLVVCTAALSITDEASCGMLGLALGAAWLLWPELLAPRRRDGVLVLLGLLAAIVVTNLACAGLLAPGSERPPMHLVPWRSPGFANATLPFTKLGGRAMFLADVAGLGLFAAAALWGALRSRTRSVTAVAVLVLTLVGLGVFALGRFDIAPKAVEAHRFVTAPMLVGPLCGLFWLARSRGADPGPAGSPAVTTLLLLALALPAASTFAWLRSPGGTRFATVESFGTHEDFHATDCRTELGARFGDVPLPTYAAKSLLHLYAGCRPTFLAGKPAVHKIKTSGPLFGLEALRELHRTMLKPDEPLRAICPAGGVGDAICRGAAAAGPCEPVGTTREGIEVVQCTLPAVARAALVEGRIPPANRKRPAALRGGDAQSTALSRPAAAAGAAASGPESEEERDPGEGTALGD